MWPGWTVYHLYREQGLCCLAQSLNGDKWNCCGHCFSCHSFTDALKWSGHCKVPLTASTRSLQGALLWEARWDVTKPGRGWWGGKGLSQKQWSHQLTPPPPSCNAWRSAHFLRLQQDQLCAHEQSFHFHTLVAVKWGTIVRAVNMDVSASSHVPQ
jgi:hypothetical protein